MSSFIHDKEFILKHDPSALILGEGDAQIIVSAKYQGKVFTSTLNGENGQSLGWVNYKAFDAPLDEHMNAYGGENRFWLGPEGGPMSLYFKKGVDQTFENWHTPAAFDTEDWMVEKPYAYGATLTKYMQLTNYADHQFKLRVNRHVELLSRESIQGLLQMDLGNLKN